TAGLVAIEPDMLPEAELRDWRVRRALNASAHPVTNWLRLRARRDAALRADPAAVWRRESAPVLAVWGQRDHRVPLRASAVELRNALHGAPNRDRTFYSFDTVASHRAQARIALWLGAHLDAKPAAVVRTPLPGENGGPTTADVAGASALYSVP